MVPRLALLLLLLLASPFLIDIVEFFRAPAGVCPSQRSISNVSHRSHREYVPLSSTEALCEKASVVDMVCARFLNNNSADPLLERPRVAWCLHGAVRTLTHPLSHRTLTDFGVAAFGGEPTVFAFLELHDETGNHWHPYPVPDSSVAATQRALRVIGWSGDTSHVRLESRADPFVYPACQPTNRRDANHTSPHFSARFSHSIAGQLYARRQCASLIASHEQKARVDFDFVVLLRPDIYLRKPMTPWCLIERLLLPKRVRDYLIVFERRHLHNVAIAPYDDFFECRELFAAHAYLNPEHYWFGALHRHGIDENSQFRDTEVALSLARGPGGFEETKPPCFYRPTY